MPALAQRRAVTLDCPDPKELADFYRSFTDGEVLYESAKFVGLSAGGTWVGFQRVADHRPPRWPDPAAPQQIHLDFFVDDLDEAEARLLELGAAEPGVQPGGERWRVLTDPTGHPFCSTADAPAPEEEQPTNG